MCNSQVDCLSLLLHSERLPPDVIVYVRITQSFDVVAFKYNTPVPINDLLGFSHKLERWCQLDEIVIPAQNFVVNTSNEICILRHRLDDDKSLPESARLLFDLLYCSLKPFLCKKPWTFSISHAMCIASLSHQSFCLQ